MLKEYPIYAYVPVKDIERARRFYEQTLGFTPKEERQGGIAYAAGGATAFFMYVSGGAGTNQASTAFFTVEDEVAELRKKGVTFEEYDNPGFKTVNGIMTSGKDKAAWFKDPDGNILAIVQQTS